MGQKIFYGFTLSTMYTLIAYCYLSLVLDSTPLV
jgi:hypothetical protein